MRVKSETSNIWKTLSTSSPYSIPYSQRPYKWGPDKWDSLWVSIFEENDLSNFLGTIILLEEQESSFFESKATNSSSSKIISPFSGTSIFDGQQRVTTLHILCKAVMEVLYDEGEVNAANDIKSYLLLDHNNNPRINVSQEIQKFFVKNIQVIPGKKPEKGVDEFEKKIFKAYEFFYKNCKNFYNSWGVQQKKPKLLYDYFKLRLEHIEIVVLTIDDYKLGIEIFESVNSTGEPLDASELVKNILIKMGMESGLDSKDVHDKWTKISINIDEAGFDVVTFLHFYWISKYKYVGKPTLFSAMKKTLEGSAQKWIDFLDEFEKYVDILYLLKVDLSYKNFKKMFPYANSNKSIYTKYINYINCLFEVNNKSSIIPILTLLDYELKINQINDESFIKNKFEKYLEKHFTFCYLHFNIFSYPTRDFTPSMYKVSLAINDAYNKHPQDPKKSKQLVGDIWVNHFAGMQLLPKTPKGKYIEVKNEYIKNCIAEFKEEKNRFFKGINNLKYDLNKKNTLIHIFYEIIEASGGSVNKDLHSFEHYLPQDPSKWGLSKDDIKQHKDKLGNLLYIHKSLNGKLGNKPHTEKIDILKKDYNNLDQPSKDFVDSHSGSGKYDFGLITKTMLEESLLENGKPSEIDKRTDLIAENLWEIFIANGPL